MTTPKEEPKAQTEQVKQEPTPESNVEVSDKNQKTQEIDEALNDSQKEQEVLVAEQDTKTEIQALEQDTSSQPQTPEQGAKTQEQTPQNLSDKEIAEIAKITDNATLEDVAKKWIKKCKILKSGIRSREGNGESKNWLTQELSGAITNMENMVHDIKTLEKKGGVYSNLDIDKNRIGEIIYNYYTNREPARQMISLGMRVPHIDSFIDSQKDAKRVAKHEKRNQEYQQKMAKLLKDPTLLHLLGDDQNALNNYYKDVINGYIEPTTHPFYTQHMQSFLLMEKVSPELYGSLVPRLSGQITYNTYCQRDPQLYQEYCRNNNIVCRPRTFNGKIGKGLADMAEYLGANKDNDPRKRQARENAGSVVALGGAIVLGFQFFKNLFSSKTKNPNKWRNVGLFGGGLLALLNLDKVTNWAQDIIGRHPAEKSRMLAESFKTYGFSDERAIDAANRYIGAPYTTMTALHFIPIYELESQKILEDKNGEIEFNYHNYENYVNKFKRYNDQKEEVLKAGKELDKQKAVGAGLRAFGITTWSDFKGLSNSDKNKTLGQVDGVKTGRGKMIERVQHGINEKLYNNGFRAKDTDAIDKIMQDYDKNSGSTNMNTFIKSWIDQGLLEFNGNLVCSMDELKADINMDNMTLNGFKNDQGQDINFNTYGELFEAANLAKYIKERFKGTQAKSRNPFHIDDVTGRIKFDDTDRYELTKQDTNAVKYGTLKKNSTLFENRKFFVDYLNMQWLLSQ